MFQRMLSVIFRVWQSPPPKKRDVLKDRVCQSHPKTQHHIPGGLDLQHSLITEFKTLLQCNLFADIWWTLPFRDGTHYWPLRQVMKTILGINHLCYWAAPHSAIGKRLVREPDSMNWQATCLLPLVYTVTKHEVMCNIQGSHSSISEDFTLLGCDTVFSGGPLEQVSCLQPEGQAGQESQTAWPWRWRQYNPLKCQELLTS